jgi:hypothetical protein
MSKHTPEPWYVMSMPTDTTRFDEWVYVCFDNVLDIALVKRGPIVKGDEPETGEANAHRIVECVNALAKIDRPAEFVAAVRELVEQSSLNTGGNSHEFVEDDTLNRLAAMLNTKEADNV